MRGSCDVSHSLAIIFELAQVTTWQNWIKWTEQREKLLFKR